MLRLFCAEWKKLWKSKLTIVILLAICGFSIVMNYKLYHNGVSTYTTTSDQSDWVYQDTKGNTITNGVAYYQFADELQNQFQGELNDETIERYLKYYQNIIQTNQRTALDDTYMKSIYGDDYESFIKMAANGEYTDEQFYNQMAIRNLRNSFRDEEGTHHYFTMFYKADHVISLYQNVMLGMDEFLSNDPNSIETADWEEISIKTLLPERFAKLTKSNEIAIQELVNIPYTYEANGKPSVDATRTKQLTQLIEVHKNTTYGSTIGSTLFVNGIGYINVITLVAIGILLSNSFAQEASTKTDQILVCSRLGNRKTTIAKLLCGVSLAIGMIVLQYVILFVMSLLYVPLSNLGLLAYGQSGLYLAQVTAYFFTYTEIIGSMFFVQMVSAMAVALLTMLCSFASKNRFACVAIVVLVLLGSKFYSLMAGDGIGIIKFLNPATMMDPQSFFNLGFKDLPYLEVGSSLLPWRYVTVGLWIIGSVIIGFFMTMQSKKHLVRTK